MTQRRGAAVIGIDQSLTAFGMTLFIPVLETYETVVLRVKTRGVQRLVELKVKIFQQIMEWGKENNIRHVCIEGYSFGSKINRELMGECAGMTKMTLGSCFGLDNKEAYPTIVAPQQLKKFVTGKANAKKDEMLLATYKKWGQEFHDDNACDSYGLARVAACVVGLSATVLAYEQDVIKKLAPNTEYPWPPVLNNSQTQSTPSTDSLTKKGGTSSVSPVRQIRKLSPPPSHGRSTKTTKSSSVRSGRVPSTRP